VQEESLISAKVFFDDECRNIFTHRYICDKFVSCMTVEKKKMQLLSCFAKNIE